MREELTAKDIIDVIEKLDKFTASTVYDLHAGESVYYTLNKKMARRKLIETLRKL